jgi:acyl carrier protein
VLRIDPEYIDPQQPVAELGLDSLMAVELKSSLEADLGVVLNPTLVFHYPTIEALVPALAGEMGITFKESDLAEPEEGADASSNAAAALTLEDLDGLTEDQLELMLSDRTRALQEGA